MARLMEASHRASNKQLQQSLLHGIAFHHAGMEAADRALVEMAFLQQDIPVTPSCISEAFLGPLHDWHIGHGCQSASPFGDHQRHEILLWSPREHP